MSEKSNSDTVLDKEYITEMGSHLILDFHGTNVDLDNVEQMDARLTKCIEDCGATIESRQYKKFEPQGLTMLFLLSESHLSIHTWPESNACAIDFYHCGATAGKRLRKAEELLCDQFGWDACTTSLLLQRGQKRQIQLNNYEDSSTIFKNMKLLHRKKSQFNDIRVFESPTLGKVLALDNQIQTATGVDDTFSNDMVRNVLNQCNKKYDDVLIIGGGNLQISEYIFQNYPKIENMTLVELDENVVNTVQDHIQDVPNVSKALEKNQLQIIYEQGDSFVQEAYKKDETYDGIIIDSKDINKDDENTLNLFKTDFYKNIHRVLKKGSSFSQMLTDQDYKEKFEKMVRIAGFTEMTFIYSYVPEFSATIPIGVCRKT